MSTRLAVALIAALVSSTAVDAAEPKAAAPAKPDSDKPWKIEDIRATSDTMSGDEAKELLERLKEQLM